MGLAGTGFFATRDSRSRSLAEQWGHVQVDCLEGVRVSRQGKRTVPKDLACNVSELDGEVLLKDTGSYAETMSHVVLPPCASSPWRTNQCWKHRSPKFQRLCSCTSLSPSKRSTAHHVASTEKSIERSSPAAHGALMEGRDGLNIRQRWVLSRSRTATLGTDSAKGDSHR